MDTDNVDVDFILKNGHVQFIYMNQHVAPLIRCSEKLVEHARKRGLYVSQDVIKGKERLKRGKAEVRVLNKTFQPSRKISELRSYVRKEGSSKKANFSILKENIRLSSQLEEYVILRVWPRGDRSASSVLKESHLPQGIIGRVCKTCGRGLFGKLLTGPWMTVFYQNEVKMKHLELIPVMKTCIIKLQAIGLDPECLLHWTTDCFERPVNTEDQVLRALRGAAACNLFRENLIRHRKISS
ncbi:hypothetical protein Btru_062333, partial [Bulinus truncatus]